MRIVTSNVEKITFISGEMTPERMKKWNQNQHHPGVDVTGERSKV